MSKGTIVLVAFPFTDLSGNKVRPCLILYEQKKGEDCIVAFMSAAPHAKLGVFEMRVKATIKNGLKKDSVLKIEKIATLQKKSVLGELGILEPELIKTVDTKLKHLFHMDEFLSKIRKN